MSNHLFDIYGKSNRSLWFPGLIQISCRTPESDLKKLNKKYAGEPAIYFLCQNRGVSYIGISGEKKSGGLFQRLLNHWNTPQKTFEFCYAFELKPELLDDWETKAIAYFQPSENVRKRDYNRPGNDDLYQLPLFLDEIGYFTEFSSQRVFRIDPKPFSMMAPSESVVIAPALTKLNPRFPKDAEGIVTYLPEKGGGRKSPAFQEYRPQFYYDGQDWDAVQQFPDVDKVEPGETARVIFSYLSPDQHLGKIQEGTIFLIREGARTVGYGRITKIMDLENSARRVNERNQR